MKAVTSWSYSAWALYTECPYKFKLTKLEGREDKPSKALLDGRKKHKAIEDFLKQPASQPFPVCATRFSNLLYALAQHPKLIVEQKWAFDRNWRESGYFKDNNTWLRSVIDAGVIYEDHSVEAIDWKSGKKYGSNSDQVELFALTIMMRYPQTTHVTTRLAYIDDVVPLSESEVIAEHKVSDREKLRDKWQKAVVPMFTDTTFAPRPNDKCGWCNFSRSKGGPCRFG